MSFEHELSHRLKALPARPLSDETIDSIVQRIDRGPLRSNQWKRSRAIGMALATLAPILLVAILIRVSPVRLWGPAPSSAAQFTIVVDPKAMTYTSLDTVAFRQTVRDYLERNSISDAGGSFTRAANQINRHQPIINQISEVAIRWSQIDLNKYGAALVTYEGNGHPRIANVLAIKNGSGAWQITQINSIPQGATVKALAKFKVYPGDWGGIGFSPFQNDQVTFEFLSGFVIDPIITNIQIVRSDGYTFSVPIVNGTYGYFTVDRPPRKAFHGYYRVWAYDLRGNLIFHE